MFSFKHLHPYPFLSAAAAPTHNLIIVSSSSEAQTIT